MKKTILIIAIIMTTNFCNAQNIGIGTLTPNNSAVLELKSDSQGLLLPRMKKTLRQSIVNPADGLLVFQNAPDSIGFYYCISGNWVWLQNTENFWSANGNANTDSTNFIGTSINKPLQFKINNLPSGKITKNNTALGYKALQNDSTGVFNIALGVSALDNQKNGSYNIAIGHNVLSKSNNANGNIAIGEANMYVDSNGIENVSIGNQAMVLSKKSSFNTIIGAGALQLNNGDNNVAIGARSGQLNFKGSDNIYIGFESGKNGASSNKLYIENSGADSNNALIYGDFANDSILLNAKTINKNSFHIKNYNALEMGYGLSKQIDNGKICYGCFGNINELGIVGGGISATGDDRKIRLYSDGGIVIGGQNNASGLYSSAMGLGTSASNFASFANGLSTQASGQYSTALDSATKANGDASFATGGATEANGKYSVAMGYDSKANGIASLSIGYKNSAKGKASVALGFGAIADSSYATASGYNNTANGTFATALDSGCTANGRASIAMGGGSISLGNYATSMGYFSRAYGNFSIAGGNANTTNSANAIAFGRKNIANGISSIAVGDSNQAIGDYSIALGNTSKATGLNTHVLGNEANAFGDYSNAIGNYVNARAFGSTVVGFRNDTSKLQSRTVWRDTDEVFVVGCGGYFGSSAKNAIAVYKNANTDISGFTRLGEKNEGSPSIKTKLLIGLGPLTDSASIFIFYGSPFIQASNILSVTVLVERSAIGAPGLSDWLPPNFIPYQNSMAGLQYSYVVGPSSLQIIYGTYSYNLYGHRIKAYITYTE